MINWHRIDNGSYNNVLSKTKSYIDTSPVAELLSIVVLPIGSLEQLFTECVLYRISPNSYELHGFCCAKLDL